MGSNFVFADKAKLKLLQGTTHHSYGEGHNRASSANWSSSPAQQEAPGSEKLVEYCCSACILSVCCPVALVWCCIKVPCKVCQHAMQKAGQWVSCGWRRKVSNDGYSSFSDIEFEETSSRNIHTAATKIIIRRN